MRVSVLIPAFNASEFLETTLVSAASGLGEEDEVIVVDDHSQDDTLILARQILNRFSCQSQVIRNKGKGACRARNQALSLASGTWVQWLDADDIIPPEKWKHVIPLAQNRTLVGCPWKPFYGSVPKGIFEDGRDWFLSGKHQAADWLADDRMMFPAAWFGERSLFQSIGDWDESLLVNQDGEYFARVIQKASCIQFTTTTEVYYRRGLTQSASSFTPEKADSLFRSTESMAQTALKLEDSTRMRQMVANRWQHFIYTAYPSRPDLIQAAQTNLKKLPEPNISNPIAVSPLSQWVSRILGWKTLTQVRMLRSKLTFR